MSQNGTGLAILMAVWATFAIDIFSAFTSSPQTTEINAQSRSGTLMKWVVIASVVAVGGGLVGTVVSRRVWPLVTTVVVAVFMWGVYEHAKRKGLSSSEPATEY